MKTIYLKMEILGRIQVAIKCMDGVSLSVYTEQISIWTEEDETSETISEWHKSQLDYQDATREDFDTLFIETVTSINDLSKL